MSLSTSEWLTRGGDQRIACDARGVNKYGCAPSPDPSILPYGSCTASTVSTIAFRAADQLRLQLETACEAPADVYGRELARVSGEIRTLCGLNAGVGIMLTASGTDAHLITAQLTGCAHVVMIEASETGSGVPDALRRAQPIEITAVYARREDGAPHDLAQIDAATAARVENAIAASKRTLLIVSDISKTGLLAPSPACAIALKTRFPQLDVLVDACQLRVAPATLRTYLAQGFLVAITGSKFLGGPAFSGALLVPEGWPAATPPDTVNFGLLLRWEAALAEWRDFHALPQADIAAFLTIFASAVQARLAEKPFAPLPIPKLDRDPITSSPWDQLPTIFPFLLHRANGAWLSHGETKHIYEQLRAEGCQLGQPVTCGTRDGTPLSALRLALSARLIVDAVSPHGCGSAAVISEALAVLERVARLA